MLIWNLTLQFLPASAWNSSPFPSRGKLKGMWYAGETNRRCLLCSCALSNCFNGLELQRDRLTFAHVYTVPPYCWLCRSPKLSTVCFQCYFQSYIFLMPGNYNLQFRGLQLRPDLISISSSYILKMHHNIFNFSFCFCGLNAYVYLIQWIVVLKNISFSTICLNTEMGFLCFVSSF